ncbi:hypothetical protein AVEN_28797-1 [Araneus ventricosus]|uniref:Uncharacterized protein n=1 Tax=Araneus ventricosus TaxID=182803 RepID=A0A4Y2IRW2_ARAVE|nr:hypothetical protein AVEN_28797-1 [Araneus ventricosus]
MCSKYFQGLGIPITLFHSVRRMCGLDGLPTGVLFAINPLPLPYLIGLLSWSCCNMCVSACDVRSGLSYTDVDIPIAAGQTRQVGSFGDLSQKRDE